MNERIRELYRQATKEAAYDYVPSPTLERFAELIVRECADISDASFHNGSAGYTAILKHFGVDDVKI